jgi:hypothetical protein
VLRLLGVPRNVGLVMSTKRSSAHNRELTLAVGEIPFADAVPRDTHPFVGFDQRFITVGWMRRGIASGRIPRRSRFDPKIEAEATLLLAVEQSRPQHPAMRCRPFATRSKVMQRGDRIDFRGALIVRLTDGQGDTSAVKGYASTAGSRLEIRAGPVLLDVGPFPGSTTSECS